MNPGNYDIKVLVMTCPSGTIYDDEKIQCLPPPEEASACNGKIAESSFYRKLDDNSLPPVSVTALEFKDTEFSCN